MAGLPPTTTIAHRHHHHHHHRQQQQSLLVQNFHTNSSSTLSLSFLNSPNNQTSPFSIHLHRSFLPFPSNVKTPSSRCFAASPGSPPPPPPTPDSVPPLNEDPGPSTGSEPTPTFSSVQDSVQIFFAVLFWMSLFFWASAWDGRNNGRPNKGSRFRRFNQRLMKH